MSTNCDLTPNTPDTPTTEAPEHAGRLSPRGRVLVADGSRGMCRLLEDLFRSRGYEASSVCDGHRVMEATESQNYDVVVIDVRLPGPDPYRLVQLMRQRGDGDRPAIVATCETDLPPEDYRALRLLGASAFVAKRDLEAEVLDRVNVLVRCEPEAVAI